MSDVFRVNSYQRQWQRDPSVAVLDDGGFLIVYESFFNPVDQDVSATIVAGQRYDASGLPVGGELLIDGIDGSSSDTPSIAVLSDGGYVVAWAYDNYGPILTLDKEAYMRVYNADGTPRTDAIRVDTVPSNDVIRPEVVALGNGGFKVVFGVDRSTDLFDQVYSQQYSANGVAVGTNTLVNTNVGDFDQYLARSATLTNGTSVVVWNSEASFPTSGDLDSNEVRATLYDADGAVIEADFSLTRNAGTVGSAFGRAGYAYDVAALQSGGFVLTNTNYDFELGLDTPDASFYTMMRFYDAAGRLEGAPVLVYASDDLATLSRVVQLETGLIVVIWEQDDETPRFVGDTIYGRVFTADGVPLTGRFDVGEDVPSFNNQEDPEIAALPGGGFIVTFTSEYIDNSDEGVAGRIFGRATAADDIATVDVTGTLFGLAGNDSLTGDALANLLDGGTGADTLRGLAGNDTLFGQADDDSLSGGDGADEIHGGPGNDSVRGGGGSDTVWLNQGNDLFKATGTDPDRVYAGLGDDTVDAGDGADTVWGGNGRDEVRLGGGDDLFFDTGQGGTFGRDTVWSGDGDDTIEGGNGDDVFGGDGGDDLIRARLGDDRVYGGTGADRIEAGAGADRVWGGDGADLVFLGDGADIFFDNSQGGVAGRDSVYAGAGNDTVEGGNGDDVIWGQGGNDVIRTRLGNDTVYAAAGSDKIETGDGDDRAWGGTGADQIFLGRGNDVFWDSGDAASDTVYGGGGADTLNGAGGQDVLWGGPGNDLIRGGEGADILRGLAGADRLDGGAGADRFVFVRGDGADSIAGFGAGDRLALEAALFADAGITPGAVLRDFAAVEGGAVVFRFDGGESITLEGVTGTAGLAGAIELF